MKNATKTIKNTNKAFKSLSEEGSIMGAINDLLVESRTNFEAIMGKIKLILVQFLLFAERESLAGPDYSPLPGWQKWGYEQGSVYAGGERLKVKKPRLRKERKEVNLSTYEALNDKNRFSEELLQKSLMGISTRQYGQAMNGLLDNFGISKSSVSRNLIQATESNLKLFLERSLSDFEPFAIFIDGYHIAGEIFIVALGLDIHGVKKILGFWQGATENHAICQELLHDLEKRGLYLHDGIIYITDGGKGIIKALQQRYGKRLIHQRCTIHKDHNLQKHLPKKYRQEAHNRYRNALNCFKYEDAKQELKKLQEWLEKINPSAAESLKEGQEELLTVHRLQVPPLLRRTLYSTNPIESMFSHVSWLHGNLKNMKSGSKMIRRWLATALLQSEKKFRIIKGYLSIKEVREKIAAFQTMEACSVA